MIDYTLSCNDSNTYIIYTIYAMILCIVIYESLTVALRGYQGLDQKPNQIKCTQFL